MACWLIAEVVVASSALIVLSASGGLRGEDHNNTDYNSTASGSLPLLQSEALTAASATSSYWDGQCTPCPAYLYSHCSRGGRLLGERGCGTANAYCEGRCSSSAPSPPVLAPTPTSPKSCVDYGCSAYVAGQDCQCNGLCPQFGNCCADYWSKCQAAVVPRRRRQVFAPPRRRRQTPAPLVPVPRSDYWDGQCKACPARFYSHCSQGGSLTSQRPCGFGNLFCEGFCSFSAVPTSAPATPSPPPAPLEPTPAPSPLADANLALLEASNGDVLSFYMYRAQGPTSYPPSNVNTGNLAGIMWYLQHEVVSGAYGAGNKFGISRVIRYTVKTKATQPLIDNGMNFGVRVAFDSGNCTGPRCDFSWQHYGYNVGCNNLGDYPYPDFNTHYSGGIWYSLPGQCPSMTYWTETPECKMQETGGMCSGTPTGAGDCTWSYENKGEEISLAELYEFAGQKSQSDFWADPDNTAANAVKVSTASELFAHKYGNDLSDPRCDFNYGRFFQ